MPTLHETVRHTAHRFLPRAARNARASMLGLAHSAHGYQRSAGHLAGPLYARAAADIAALALPAGARILDAGTGPGLLPLRIAAACPQLRIDAVDLSPEMVDVARENVAQAGLDPAITLAVADVARLPFPDGSFDLVVSTISQHHWDDPAAGLREVARVLRPGGQAWIYDFRWALRRAQRAAGSLPSTVIVRRESPLPGSSRWSLIGRLVLRPGDPRP